MTESNLTKGLELFHEIEDLQKRIYAFNSDYNIYTSNSNGIKLFCTLNAYNKNVENCDIYFQYIEIDKDLFNSIIEKQRKLLNKKLDDLNKQFKKLKG